MRMIACEIHKATKNKLLSDENNLLNPNFI